MQIAPDDDKHHLHYGGICCYSCRAFFRRAHQATKEPNFQCKNGETCEITVKNRRKCQRCRYNKCLKIGMDAKWVLTNDQKKIRFRNFLRKKETSTDSPNGDPQNSVEAEHSSFQYPYESQEVRIFFQKIREINLHFEFDFTEFLIIN